MDLSNAKFNINFELLPIDSPEIKSEDKVWSKIDTRPPCMKNDIDEASLKIINCGSKKLCSLKECRNCYDKSFISHPRSKYWSTVNDISPREITKGSGKMITFNCDKCNHSFTARLNSIISNQWCPYCAVPSRILCNDNECKECWNKSFLSVESSKYLIPDINVNPRQIFKGSCKKLNFKCEDCKHITENSPNAVSSKWQCAYCGHKKLCLETTCLFCFNLSFQSSDKAKYWSTNNTENPRDVFKNVSRKYNFTCGDCNHEFSMTLNNISNGQWCPYCNHSKLCGQPSCQICFGKSLGAHEKSKYVKDKTINILMIPSKSDIKIEFNCDKCTHSFIREPREIDRGNWCPYCSHQKLCNSDCKMCFENSFAFCKYAYMWSDKNISTARQVYRSSNNKYYLNCDKCGHTFYKTLKQISNSSGCPYCYLALCGDLNCKYCFIKSFAQHPKSKYWSLKNKKMPYQVAMQSNRKYFFNCDKCEHEFMIEPSTICAGSWYPYCSIICKQLCANICVHCFNRSFESCSLSKYWSIKNNSHPRSIIKNSNIKYIFNCQYCNEEYNSPLNYSAKRNNSGCNKCKYKTEHLLSQYLSKYFKITNQAKFEWCKNEPTGRYFSFDFLLEDSKIIIELDGFQHFNVCTFTENLDFSILRDVYKMYQALQNGYTIIRVSQEDVWNDKLNLDECLLPNIKTYDEPKLIFISSKENLYDKHYSKFLEISDISDIDPENIDVTFINEEN